MTAIPAIMNSLVEQLPTGVVFLDDRNNIIFYNKKALRLLMMPIENFVGNNFLECVALPSLRTALEEFNEGKTGTITIQLSVGYASLSASISDMVTIANERIIFILIDDITRYKCMENIKIDFISALLHKIRNPLTSVKTALSLMTVIPENEASGIKRELHMLSLKEIDRLNDFLRQTKSVFSIETGLIDSEIELESLDIVSIIERAIDEQYRERVKLHCQSAKVCADFEKLTEALRQIIKNALQYSNSVVTIQATASNGYISIDIEDKGIGIAENEINLVFDKYFRGERAASLYPEGNGIGLFFARAYIEHFGGSVLLDSQYGKGTTFSITLPEENR